MEVFIISKRALITGITGQDGSYLAEYLLSKGYEVHGLIRKASTFNTGRIDHLYRDPHETTARFFLHYGDITDASSTTSVLRDIEPSEVYHLASQSHVKVSFELPTYTGYVTGIGATILLEAIRKTDIETRFYNAASSEMFGSSPPPQNEQTRFHPRSPYAAAKVYSFWITTNYREAYGLHASNGILFNHESPRRGETFVTRKITRAIANILAKREDVLYLGNLKAKRDWGYAPEFIMGMYEIMQLNEPEDIALGTGISYSVEDFLTLSFEYVGLDWHDYVKIDPKYLRPSEVDSLTCDSSKAKRLINWKPKVGVPELTKIMIDYDMKTSGLKPPNQSQAILNSNGLSWVTEPPMSSVFNGV